jgi:hypothetical protein
VIGKTVLLPTHRTMQRTMYRAKIEATKVLETTNTLTNPARPTKAEADHRIQARALPWARVVLAGAVGVAADACLREIAAEDAGATAIAVRLQPTIVRLQASARHRAVARTRRMSAKRAVIPIFRRKNAR